MALTVKRSIAVAEHLLAGALGGPIDGFSLVSQAGRMMEGGHDWLYLQRTTKAIAYRPEFSGIAASYDTVTSYLTLVGAFLGYVFVPGDTVSITIGGNSFGTYPVSSKISNDILQVNSTLTGGPYAVDFTMDTSRAALPMDFGRLIRLEGKDSFITRTVPSTPSEILTLQTSAIPGTGFTIVYAVEFNQATPTSAPVPTLRLWPQPSSEDFEALGATYSREWPSFSSDVDEIPIPPYMEALFLQYVRATAGAYHPDGTSAAKALELSAAYDSLRSSRLFLDAAKRDSETNANRGTIPAGAIRSASYGRLRDPLKGIDTARLFTG